MGGLSVGRQIVGVVVEDGVDLRQVDEVGDVDGVGTLGLVGVQLLGLDEHVLALGDLVALDDVLVGDLPSRLLRHPPVVDAVPRLVELVELEIFALHG